MRIEDGGKVFKKNSLSALSRTKFSVVHCYRYHVEDIYIYIVRICMYTSCIFIHIDINGKILTLIAQYLV